MRLRITFRKTEAMRFTGHLDLHRTWERTFRRAGLPLSYSHGFHPQPRINLACALPLGFTSQSEMVDVWLENEQPVGKIKTALDRAVPPGIEVLEVVESDPRQPALQTQVHAAEYQATLLDPTPRLNDRIAEILAAQSLPRERRGKNYDLRPLIEDIQHIPDDERGHACLRMILSARAGATGRPEEVLAVLDIPPESARIQRTRIIFEAEEREHKA